MFRLKCYCCEYASKNSIGLNYVVYSKNKKEAIKLLKKEVCFVKGELFYVYEIKFKKIGKFQFGSRLGRD